jgi:hypothetical protein
MKAVSIGLVLLVVSGGCVLEDCKSNILNRYRAAAAFDSVCYAPEHACDMKDYAHGWKRGYYDMACGGNGCPPVLPPECYWSCLHQNPEGHRKVHVWYEGYRHGTIAAERTGVREWNYVGTAPPQAPLHSRWSVEPGHAIEQVFPAPPAAPGAPEQASAHSGAGNGGLRQQVRAANFLGASRRLPSCERAMLRPDGVQP